jgi:primosomal protein N''
VEDTYSPNGGGSEIYQMKCQEYENRIAVMSEDYSKLKGIMDSLQEKMTVLVQENSKLNKNLLDYDGRLVNEQNAKRMLEDKLKATDQEY